jgi:hypothetical protein
MTMDGETTHDPTEVGTVSSVFVVECWQIYGQLLFVPPIRPAALSTSYVQMGCKSEMTTEAMFILHCVFVPRIATSVSAVVPLILVELGPTFYF